MLRLFVLLLALLPIPAVLTDDTAPSKSASSDEIAKLIDRIDQLEKRIKEMERQAARPQTAPVTPPYYLSPPTQAYIPNTNPPQGYSPQAPAYPYAPQATPAVPYQMPPTYNKTVPDSWKPFNFNGMQYYIIPVDEAERMGRPQGNDKTNR
jgi:hypothetical protein